MTTIQNLPAELRDTARFCVWRYEQRDGRPSKVPYDPRTGGRARSNDPLTFAPFSVAQAVQGQYDGLGVGIFGDLSAVDIDHCVDENGMSELAADIVQTMDAYAEISPSGKGVRILFRAADFAYDKNAYFINNQKAGLEVYVAGATQKYVTVTGNAIASERGLHERGQQLQIVLDKYMRRSAQTISPPLETGAAALDDDTLLQKARGGKNGERFTALYDHGDLSAYNSHSEADQALCNLLAYYCGNNPKQIDRLFRSSALCRDKWSREDYRRDTIHKAIAACNGRFYSPRKNPRKKTLDIDGEQFEVLSERALTAYLSSIGVSIRYNVINRTVEITGADPDYNPESLQNDLPVILHDRLKGQLKQCDKTGIQDLLGVIAGKNRFNPVVELLESATWDGIDRIQALFDILHISAVDQLSRTLVYKWLWQALSMARNELQGAYGADGILVLQGPQGIGKTSVVRKLAVYPGLCKLGQYLDSKDKDTYRRACSAWIVEFGEIESTFKSDLERLKAFITAELDEYRLPYGRSDQTLARRTAIIGTCNSEQFLIDPTGSRRFWTIPVAEIDLRRLADFDSLQLWLQVDKQTRHDRQGFRLTKDEQAQLAVRNTEHEKLLPSQAEVMDILSKDDPDYSYRDVTTSQFKDSHRELSRYTADQIGKALSKLGIPSKPVYFTVDGKRKSARLRSLPVIRSALPL